MGGKSSIFDAVLFGLAVPVMVLMAGVRLIRRMGFFQTAIRTAIECLTCGGEISLVGFWRCKCGFTFQGHVMQPCPICATAPNMIRCYRCGATRVLPR